MKYYHIHTAGYVDPKPGETPDPAPGTPGTTGPEIEPPISPVVPIPNIV